VDQQRAAEAARALAPRSYSVAVGAFAGLIAVIAIGIYVSPVYMRWWFFLGGALAGVGLLNGISNLARAGRVRVPDTPLLDRALGLEREPPRPRNA